MATARGIDAAPAAAGGGDKEGEDGAQFRAGKRAPSGGAAAAAGDGGAVPLLDTRVAPSTTTTSAAASSSGGWRPNAASRFHDYVNIAQIPLLFVLSVACNLTDRVWVHATLVVYAVLYFLFDSLWIMLQPSIVKEPRVLLVHHLVALVLLAEPAVALLRLGNMIGRCRLHAPHCYEVGLGASLAMDLTGTTGKILVVEINTLFLILRRTTNMGRLFEVGFYVTWVLVRLMWYPYLLFQHIWPRRNVTLMSKAAFTLINVMQWWWTSNFLKPSYWRRQKHKFGSGHGAAEAGETSPEKREKYL